jgi:large subunit ribosomal protein L21
MKFAIIESGGKQYRAVEGGILEVDRLPVETGASVKLEQTLLIAEGESVTVGTPVVKETPVWATVLAHFKGEKVTIFNYSPKKRIRVKTGHRQNYTRLSIEQIGGSELVKKEPAKKAEKVSKAKVEAETEQVQAGPAKKPAATAKKAAPKAEKKPAAKTATKTAVKAAARVPAKKTPSTKAAPKKTTSKAAPKKPATKKPSEKK